MDEIFPENGDARVTLGVIRRFQDWAASVGSRGVISLDTFFDSFARILAEESHLPLVTVWDNNEYASCLVLQASVPERPRNLPHSIPIEGTLTGEAVKKRSIAYSKVQNPVLIQENITQMITIPVLSLTTDTVAMVVNLYFRTDDRPMLPVDEQDTARLLSRLSTVFQNEIYKRDNDIESKVRNIAASAKGISSLFDGISKHIQEITRCSYALLFSWDERERKLAPEGYFFVKSEDWSASRIHHLQQERANYLVNELKEVCIEKGIPFVYRKDLKLDIAITLENDVTVQCQYVGVPIISSEGKAIGVLACGDPTEMGRLAPSFSSFDVEALQIFSNALSPSIERVLVSRQEPRLISISKSVSNSMVRSYDLNKNLQNAIEAIVRNLHSEVGSLYVLDDKDNTLRMVAAKGSNEKLIGDAKYQIGEGITGTIAQGEVIHFKSREELVAHPKFAGKYDQIIWEDKPNQRETFLGVPVVIGDRVKGVLKLSNVIKSQSHPDPYYTDEDIQVAQVVSSFLAYAIQNDEQEEKRLKQFTSLAKTSIGIQKSATEEDAILSVVVGLADVDINGMLLSLYDPNTGDLVGNQLLGDRWKEPPEQYKCHIDDDDVRARVLRENEESEETLATGEGESAREETTRQFVLPLRLDDELIGTLQFDVETAKLNHLRKQILRAFASHLAIAISRLRSIRHTFDLTNVLMRHSRFIMAETVSAMALHSVHHKLKDINKQLRDHLSKTEVKENRFLLDTLKEWRKILDGLERELNDIVTFVRAPADETNTKPRDVHPEIQATISTWYNYIRGHNCKVLPPELEATSSRCRISPQAFREILAVLLVNSVQAHARTISIKTYKCKDVHEKKNEPSKNIISSAFCLQCSDDGVGLSTDMHEEIFNANYTTKPANFGSGLGLFVARELARNAGGDLEVSDTKQPKGVTFQLTLPLLEDAA